MAADNKVEIKLITDYRDCLLSKIESLKGSLGQIASSFGNEVSSSIDEFNKRMNIKLKTIDERFTKNTEELEALRAELLSKKFDESNFNNVSIIRTLDKTIKERDLKIKELESRIRYLEGNSASTSTSTNASVAKKEQVAPIKQKLQTIASKKIDNVQELVEVQVIAPALAPEPEKDDKFKDALRVEDADGDIVIAVSAKKSRSKTDKKKAQPASIVQDTSSEPAEAIVDEKPKKPIRKIKKASKVEKEEETEPAPAPAPKKEHTSVVDVDVDVDVDNDATEAQLLADEEALRLAQEEADEAEEAERLAEEQRLADEEAEEQRLEEERVAKAAAELEKKKKTEVVKKQTISKKDINDAKESSTSKKITSKTILAPVLPSSKTKETLKVNPGYPDKLPEVEDLDVITVNDNDYYCDKNNQGVYQMINGDDIGAFLGYYDLQSETINAVEE